LSSSMITPPEEDEELGKKQKNTRKKPFQLAD
jgi:hypothetical protein